MSPATERPASPHIVSTVSRQLTWQRDRVADRLKRANGNARTARSLAALLGWPLDSAEAVLSDMQSLNLVTARTDDDGSTWYVLTEEAK